VIGRRRHLLRGLLEHGFRPGLEPQRPSIGAMHALVPTLLDAFDARADPADEAYVDTLKGSRTPPIASARKPPSTGGP